MRNAAKYSCHIKHKKKAIKEIQFLKEKSSQIATRGPQNVNKFKWPSGAVFSTAL